MPNQKMKETIKWRKLRHDKRNGLLLEEVFEEKKSKKGCISKLKEIFRK